MMARYRVIADWNATYKDPISLEAGEQLWLTGKTDAWDGHVWVWAKNKAGKSGWIPDTLVETRAQKCFARTAFSALEMTCYQGQELEVIVQTHGWALCNTPHGVAGWVPLKNLRLVGSEK